MSPRAPSSQDEAAARALLEEGVAALGLSLPATTLEALWRYAGLLVKWNRVYSLTAITRLDELVTHHLLDALAVWPWVRQERVLVDVGSGAGLPGIVLALAVQAEGQPLEVHSLDAVATFFEERRNGKAQALAALPPVQLAGEIITTAT